MANNRAMENPKGWFEHHACRVFQNHPEIMKSILTECLISEALWQAGKYFDNSLTHIV